MTSDPIFITQVELASRWRISEATLERDRSLKKGVRYMKIGGLIRYRLDDVLVYEDSRMRETATQQAEREECAKVCDEIKKKNMNERIEELALDAGLLNYVDNETPRRCFIHGHADLEEVQEFAQMIVKDCLNELCDQMDKHNINLSNLPGWYRALEDTEKQFNT